MKAQCWLSLFAGVFLLPWDSHGGAVAPEPLKPAERSLAEYFETETARLAAECLASIRTAPDWERERVVYRRQLQEMLGLLPWPERNELQATITGRVVGDGVVVEKLHFQSLPGLFVTGNLYLPQRATNRVPAVLYVCGHSRVASNGVSYGNKTGYQHHGLWFARNGYACLILDTIQLGEIEGLHHGTYREGMWWWNSRGYTPAGVEAWNGIRALDYLETRPEVDGTKFGVTGRSGGGAYSWWIAALDDRVRVAAPVAGITDLRNHVVEGTVEGHCDCMFLVNTYRWDYAQVAALVAPRPLLIANSDKDSIFPLEGVVRLHAGVRRIYELLGAADRLGLLITEGPHSDTQDLQLPVFRWFNRHLLGRDPLIQDAAERQFRPDELKVFGTLPSSERTSKIHETFVAPAPRPVLPRSSTEWAALRESWRTALRERVFAGWPPEPSDLEMHQQKKVEREKIRLESWTFESQPRVSMPLVVLRGVGVKRPVALTLHVLDEVGWSAWSMVLQPVFGEAWPRPREAASVARGGEAWVELRERLLTRREAAVFLAPRGVGPGTWSGDAKKQVQLRRRFMLLGQTLDGMRVWDVVRAAEAVRRVPGLERAGLTLEAEGHMAVNALYASLFATGIAQVDLGSLPTSQRDGPDYLNVLRFLDLDAVTAMAAERSRVRLRGTDAQAWDYPRRVVQLMGWGEQRFTVSE